MSENNHIVHVTLSDLPVHCPTDETKLWNEHPRVFIELSVGAPENSCPYCSTKFKLDVSEEEKKELVDDPTDRIIDI
ncbi:zinc-finger domain-containing protein [Thiotrichales bacterium 19X7-9]|nr:zinc-finger domain-containing protein [Thiotrichales bacterium 19X7-9]TNF65496.1 MAG: zinc-finger domain-containing protein [Gammaproteobacteria bacterium]UTW43075.1 zinc-finger domain-containing protein [bacterium SCSIO 12844]